MVGPNEALLSTWTGSRSDSHNCPLVESTLDFSRKPSFWVFPLIHVSSAGDRQEEPEHHPLRPRGAAACQCLSRGGEGWRVGLDGCLFSGEDVLPVVCPGKGDDCPGRSAQSASSSRIRRRVGTLGQSERKHAALGEDVPPSKSAWFVTQTPPNFLPGVSALFTWGVIAENGSTHIAVVPGGWTEDQLEEPTTYLKVSPPHLHHIPSSADGWYQLAPGRGVEVPSGGVHVRWGPQQGRGGE